jgi:membrane protein implicated in regulation of membrane protease activity
MSDILDSWTVLPPDHSIAVVECLDPSLRVSYSATTWPARLLVPTDRPLKTGQRVKIVERRGLTLVIIPE